MVSGVKKNTKLQKIIVATAGDSMPPLMRELYKMIEDLIRESGYPGEIDGREFYNDLCDEMEERENGTYLLMIKQEGDTYFECRVDIMDDNFDIPFMDIHDGDKVYHVDFDAE